MFVDFGDYSFDVNHVIGFSWLYAVEQLENALGFNMPTKTDKLAGCEVMFDTGHTIKVADPKVAAAMKEWYEHNVKAVGVFSQSSTLDL